MTPPMPLYRLIETHVLEPERLHGDETTVPILAKGRTVTGRIWTYVRDDRPFEGQAPPAAVYYASRDRRGEHPQRHLQNFTGILQADAYNGLNGLFEAERQPTPITPAFCWAHSRRQFFELADIAKNARRGRNATAISPIALEAVKRIDALFNIEREINGLSAEKRLRARQERSVPLLVELETWLREQRNKLSRSSNVLKPINYMLNRWAGFARFTEDGRICMTTDGADKRESSARRSGHGRSRGWLFLPRRHHSLVGLLSTPHVVGFPLADLLDPIVPTWSRFAIFARSAGFERCFA
jgi:transposase